MSTDAANNSTLVTSFGRWLARTRTAVMCLAIVVLGVQLFSAANESFQLKKQLAELRAEAGHLNIYDRSKVYVVRIKAKQPNEWAWRIYLPGNHTFILNNQQGNMPALDDAVIAYGKKQNRSGGGASGSINSGEFVLRFRLSEEPDGQWIAKVICRNGGGSWGKVPRTSWLADRDWEESSAIPAEGQREFPADATFDLIRLRQESAVDTDDPERRAETIALWITGASSNGP